MAKQNQNMTPVNPQLQQQDILSQIQERLSKAKKTEAEANKIQSDIESQKISDQKSTAERLATEQQTKINKADFLSKEKPNITPVREEQEAGPTQDQNIFDIASEGYGEGQFGPEPEKENMLPDRQKARDYLVQDTIAPSGGPVEQVDDMVPNVGPAGQMGMDDEENPEVDDIVKRAPDFTEDPTGEKVSSFINGTGSTLLGESENKAKLFSETISNLQTQLNNVGQESKELEDIQEEASKHQTFIREMGKIRDDVTNKFKQQTEELEKERENLRSPSYIKAIQDIPIMAKIGAVIHAGIQGFLGKDPMALINSLIERNYQDQVSELKLETELLDKKENMISKFFNITKDNLATKMEYQKYMYDVTIDAYSKELESDRYNAQQKTRIQTQINNLVTRREEIDVSSKDNRIQAMQKEMEKRYDRFHKDRTYQLNVAKFKQKSGGGGASLESRRRVAGREIPFYGKEEAKAYTNAIVPKKTVIKSLNSVKDIAKKLGEGKVLQSTLNTALAKAGEHLPVLTRLSPKVREAYTETQQLTRGLIQTALQARISFTGGGNMNDNERRILFRFHQIAEEGSDGNFENIKLDKQLHSLVKGDYSILIDMLNWENAHSAYTEYQSRAADQSISFDEFAEKELGFKGKTLKDLIRRNRGGGKFMVNLGPIISPEENR